MTGTSFRSPAERLFGALVCLLVLIGQTPLAVGAKPLAASVLKTPAGIQPVSDDKRGNVGNTTQVCNNTAVTIGPGSGNGSPAPSTISISGETGDLADISITLNDIQHSWASDVEVLLVGPGGENFVPMNDVGGSDGQIAGFV